MSDFKSIKVGDRVTRGMASSPTLLMPLSVTHIDETFVYCGPPGMLPCDDPVILDGWWKFRRDCGAEVDEGFAWTLSQLVHDAT
jgi:hypothetical protein